MPAVDSLSHTREEVKNPAKPRKSKPLNAGKPNLQSSLENILQPAGKKISIPAPDAFAFNENDAHSWSIPVVVKYLEEVIELPKYAPDFKRAEINGLKFIGMTSDNLNTVQVDHKLHSMKIASHSTSLREKVLEKAAIYKPTNVKDWGAVHTAAWLSFNKQCSEGAVAAIRSVLSGEVVINSTVEELTKKVSGLKTNNQERTVEALIELRDMASSDITDTGVEPEFNKEKLEQGKKEVKEKPKTRMQQKKEAKTKANNELNLLNSTKGDQSLSIINEQDEFSFGFSPSSGDDAVDNNTFSDSEELKVINPVEKDKKSHIEQPNVLIPEEKEEEVKFVPSATKLVPAELKALQEEGENMRSYVNSTERKSFLNKINLLQKVVESHVKSMNRLRIEANLAQQENKEVQEYQKQLLASGATSRELISTLVKDRDLAVKELENVVNMYKTHSAQEKETLSNDIQQWMTKTNRLIKENQTLLQQSNQGFSGNQGEESETAEPTMTDLLLQNLKDTTVANNDVMGTLDNLYDNDDDSDLDIKLNIPDQNLQNPVKPIQKPLKSSLKTSAEVSKSPSKPILLKSEDPLDLAETQNWGKDVGLAGKGEGGKGKDNLNLLEMVQQSTVEESDLWKRVIKRYKFTKSAPTVSVLAAAATEALRGVAPSTGLGLSDSRLLVGKVAIRWVRLGLIMLEAAHSKDTEKDIAGALQGLEKCSLSILTSQQSDHSDSPQPLTTSLTHQSLTSLKTGNSPSKRSKKPSGEIVFPSAGPGKVAFKPYVNQYSVAVGMVFGLATVQRVLNRFSSAKEQPNLLFLLNKVKFGEMPMTELSRDNVRDFLDFQLDLELPWDKFDSVCQKMDPDRNGFVAAENVISSFQFLTPNSDKLPPPRAEFLNLFILTASVDKLSKYNEDIGEAFLHLITKNTKSSPSFARYMEKEQKNHVMEVERLQNGDEGALWIQQQQEQAKRRILRERGLEVQDGRIVEEQLFAADVFFELTKDLVERYESSERINWSIIDSAEKDKFNALEERFKFYQPEFEFLKNNHYETCTAVAKGLQVYSTKSNNSIKPSEDQQQGVAHLSTLFKTFLNFRAECINKIQNNEKSIENQEKISEFFNNSVDLKNGNKIDNNSVLSKDELLIVENQVLKSFQTLSGNKNATLNVDDKANNCQLIGELIGTPVPSCLTLFDRKSKTNKNLDIPRDLLGSQWGDVGKNGLLATQLTVESALFLTNNILDFRDNLLKATTAVKDDKKTEKFEILKKPLASSKALKQLQEALHWELWNKDNQKGGLNTGQIENNEKVPNEFEFETIKEVNNLMSKQRLDQILKYLDILNQKAMRKKKVLNSLMNLWKSTKILLLNKNSMDDKNVLNMDQHEIRSFAMPKSEIIKQTIEMQNIILIDMQQPMDTKTIQLVNRVKQLKQAINDDAIPDYDQTLLDHIKEVEAMEKGLLQANNDAMKIAAKITKHLKKVN